MGDLDQAVASLRKAFSLSANINAGESMPNPATDSSFKRFIKSEKFRAFLSEIGADVNNKSSFICRISTIMRVRTSILSSLVLVAGVCLLAVGSNGQEPTQQEDLRKQIGTIIVTPGNGPNLAVADFISRSPDSKRRPEPSIKFCGPILISRRYRDFVGKASIPRRLSPIRLR